MFWVLCICVSLLVTSITTWVHKWRNPKCSGQLPPGSMGLPLLGETIHYFKPDTTSATQPFIKERLKKYGPIFKTSILGKRVIVTTDLEFNNFVYQQGRHFQKWNPKSVADIFGKQIVEAIDGFRHKYIKHMISSLFGNESIKKMLPEIEQSSCKKLELWSSQNSIELRESTASLIFDLTAKKLISYDAEKSLENLREYYAAFTHGLISIPINIPGTSYHKCLKGRERAIKMLGKMLEERCEKPKDHPVDFFDYVIEELKKEGTMLTEQISIELMFLLLFASYESTSLSLTLAIKFLSDHPLVLKRLTEEHEEILRNRQDVDSGLTWNEFKSMTYTFQFIKETARLGNIAPMSFRQVFEDVQYENYTIPAGWVVLVSSSAVHLNPDNHEDPLVFNPSRWEGSEFALASNNFMAFGGGMRFCIGAEFSRVQMAVFLHCLVTKYRWEEIRGGNILRNPILQFPNGYHVKLNKKEI